MSSRTARATPPPVDPTALAHATARRMQSLHRSRNRLLGETLFADPAWDILLDLFVCSTQGRRLSVSAVGFGISGSPATALRYMGLLQSRGLIVRTPDPSDGRRSFVELTASGRDKLEHLLTQHAMP